MKLLRDPFATSCVVFGALVAIGFAAIAAAYRGSAPTQDVARQLPYLVSGGFGGVAIASLGFGLLAIQLRRRDDARARAELARLVEAAADLLHDVRGRS